MSGSRMEPETLDGKYQLVKQLGEGGMGAVYEARHLGTGRRVAVKVIASEQLTKAAGIVERFQREARVTGAIETQHIAHVLDTGTDAASGRPYLVMEFLSGEDASQLVTRLGPLAPDVAMRVVAQACIGLDKAHEAGVVHRDVKPANLYLAKRDAGEVVVKLLDFGIAKIKMENFASVESAGLTKTGAMLGSPLYMSPEQAQGAKNIDARTDVWSLGVVLYELLCGKTPHGHIDTMGGLILAICSQPPRLVQEHAPWVPKEVAAIVHEALRIDPAARTASAAKMLEALRALLANGWSLNESMLVGISAEARTVVAPKLELTAQSPRPAPAAAFAQTMPDPASTPGTTTAGLAESRATAPAAKRARAMPIAIAAGVVVAAATVVGYTQLTKHDAAPATTTPSAIAPPASSPPASASAAPATTASAIAAPSAIASASAAASAPVAKPIPVRPASPTTAAGAPTIHTKFQ